MELPIKIIIIISLSAITLGFLLQYFTTNIGAEQTKLEAEQLFNVKCSEYQSKGCDWDLTFAPDFQDYIIACKTAYGDDGKFTCFFTKCCNPSATNLECEAKCRICQGMSFSKIPIGECCTQYRDNCQERCAVCVG